MSKVGKAIKQAGKVLGSAPPVAPIVEKGRGKPDKTGLAENLDTDKEPKPKDK